MHGTQTYWSQVCGAWYVRQHVYEGLGTAQCIYWTWQWIPEKFIAYYQELIIVGRVSNRQ